MTSSRSKLRPVHLIALALTAATLLGLAFVARKVVTHGGRALAAPDLVGEVADPPNRAAAEPPAPGTTTVELEGSDEVLTNPGMGFTSFHFGWWCNLPPITYPPKECAKRVRQHWPENYPAAGTAYFRWHWRDIEPERGQFAFDMIDAAIQSANQLGMTLSFRVMTVAEGKSGLPDWLMNAPHKVSGDWRPGDGGKTFWPDYRDPKYQSEHARMIAALGNRYNGHPAVDHVDIGTVGCWGEWNTACLSNVESLIEVYEPSSRKERRQIVKALTQLIDHHLTAFSKTPVIMLGLNAEDVEMMVHATRGGAGWRADCWGDWGLWGGSWSHQGKLYPPMIAAATAADAEFVDVWKRAPIQLEICGTLEKWNSLGWTASKPDGKVYKSFQWALAQHASVLNAKSKPVPGAYTDAIDELLKRVGYRFTVDRFNHGKTVQPGANTTFISQWRNLGVAPAYLPRTLTYRLRGKSKSVIFASSEDIRTWLPGSWNVSDTVRIPDELPTGTYQVDVAILDRDGTAPATTALPPLLLGNAGRRADGWYRVSALEVK
ncbi:MAG: DUF4832 domain-containing protein [Polyangiales bacterium]